MKKNILLTTLILIIICFLGISIKSEHSNDEFYEETFVDTSHNNSNILIIYPQFESESKQSVNDLIINFVENFASSVYGSDYANLNLKVEKYNITYYNGNLLSIVFEANGYVSTAAYPNKFLHAINIDIKSESIISLSDIYSVDDVFSSIIYNDFYEQFAPQKLKEWGINEDDESYESYIKDLSYVAPFNLEGTLANEKKYYLQEDTLVFCVTIPHAIGDYFQVEVKYSELNNFLNRKTLPFIEVE